jgi:signal transduction histidine kinase
MGRLIVDLLAYTDLSRADFRRQSVDLEVVFKGVLRMFADEINRIDAQVNVELPAKYILGDRTGIERVLLNLTANALKFTHANRRLCIRIFSERKSLNVRVCVADNGIGIDPKYQERIFGVFERLSSGGSPVSTGIGLAIVKRSVEKMGGVVGVESKPSVGSCFWFELPEAAQKEPALERPLPEREQV